MQENQQVSEKQEFTAYLEKISEKHLFLTIKDECFNLKNTEDVAVAVEIILQNKKMKELIKATYEKVLNRITDPWISEEAAAYLQEKAENKRKIIDDPNNLEYQRLNRLMNDD